MDLPQSVLALTKPGSERTASIVMGGTPKLG